MTLDLTPLDVIKIITKNLGIPSFLRFTSTSKRYLPLRESPEHSKILFKYYTKCCGRTRRSALYAATKLGDVELVTRILGGEKIIAPEALIYGMRNESIRTLLQTYLEEYGRANYPQRYAYRVLNDKDFVTTGHALAGNVKEFIDSTAVSELSSIVAYYAGASCNKDITKCFYEQYKKYPQRSELLEIHFLKGFAKKSDINTLLKHLENIPRNVKDVYGRIIYIMAGVISSGCTKNLKIFLDEFREYVSMHFRHAYSDHYIFAEEAAKTGNAEMVAMVIDYYESLEWSGELNKKMVYRSLAIGACKSGNLELFQYAEKQSDAWVYRSVYLTFAASKNMTHIVEYIIKKYYQQCTLKEAITCACSYGNIRLEKYLRTLDEEASKIEYEYRSKQFEFQLLSKWNL